MAPKLTNPLKPVARYRKGKPIPGSNITQLSESESDSNDDEDRQGKDVAKNERRFRPTGTNQDDQNDDDDDDDDELIKKGLRLISNKTSNTNTKKVRVGVKVSNTTLKGKDKETSSEYETDSEEEGQAKGTSRPTFNKPTTMATAITRKQSSSEYETDSEEEEESDEEEEERKAPIYKPVFVSKRNRDTIKIREEELDPEVLEAKREAELAERKKQSHDLVAESIIRELASKDVEAVFPDVDDTDGLDPQAEFEEWKLRELKRIKRDKEALYAREKEREEVEARRALPERLRLKEDLEHAKKTREEKKKGQQVFGQRYHHKGAFYADADILQKHDYTAPTESTIKDLASLPKAMQNKNFGKMSQSKYTHLADQDTSKDAGWGRKPSAFGGNAKTSGCFNCGGNHMRKDCPNPPSNTGSNPSPSSSTRDSGWSSRAASPRRDDGGDRYPPRRDDDRRDDGRRYQDRDIDRERRGGRNDDPYHDRRRDDRDRRRDDERSSYGNSSRDDRGSRRERSRSRDRGEDKRRRID